MADLTLNQAIHNLEILSHQGVIFTTNAQGDLSYISNFNVFGRIWNYIKNLIDGEGDHKVNKVILASFEKIKEYAESHPDKPAWTYHYEWHGMDWDIGFDKVAMRVLLDKSRFDSTYYSTSETKADATRIKIRKAAHDVLKIATKEREKQGIDFDSDHMVP